MRPIQISIVLILAALAAPILVSAQAPSQPAASPILEEVVAAMGGRDRVLAARTLVMEGSGVTYILGQNRAPEADPPAFEVSEYRRTMDFAGRRWRQEVVRTPRFLAGNPAPQRQVTAVDADVGFDVAADGTPRRVSAVAAADRANELFYHPLGIIQAALAEGTEVTDEGRKGRFHTVRLNIGGNKFGLLLDPRTKLPARVTKYVYHPNLGDVVLETDFLEYRELDGVQIPTRLVTRLEDRWPLGDIRLTSIAINADAGDLAAPEAVRAAEAPAPTANVTTEEIAPGVWYLAGQSHHSVVIEFADHLVLVEAPQNEARTLAVIRTARALRPEKPLRSVINSHHHFDHSAGIRAAIAEGLTVVTHERNAAFYREIATRRHFIIADTLARGPQPLRLQTVGERRLLRDGSRTVEVYPISDSPHAETLLMVYLPAERLLIEADVYSPPAPNAAPPPAFPFAANLLENIERRRLDVERIVPLHGRVVPIAELRAAARARAPGTQ
ncbi:MAG: MBL fold metallo-hydrolase [Gemmatimonadota bacterium]|nr:MBL fold metallo-hydrolase [Gemmatimonadota bacterium]